MDNDTAEMIRQLCTRAGMIMEDYSAFALSLRPDLASDLGEKLDELSAAIGRAATFVSAAKALTQ